MAKPPRPTVVEKIQAKQAAAQPPALGFGDLANLVFAARRALAQLPTQDLANVTNSVVLAESILAFEQRRAAAQAPATPPLPAEPAKG